MSKKVNGSGKAGKIVLFAVEIVILFVLVVGLWLILKATGKIDKSRTGETSTSSQGVLKISLDEDDLAKEMAKEVQENETMKGYRNIALFGVDSRNGLLATGTRSDTIMIASINQETKEVKLVSVYRDTYLNQMGSSGNFGKCNASYAYGGAEQAIKMLNSNLDLDITDFVTIGFEGLRDAIDALGGVYIDVTEEEIAHINNYQISLVNDCFGGTYTPVTEPGRQLLDGIQATAYCRVRYTAGSDFMRTQRQRDVIQATLAVAKTAPASDLKKICTNVFSEVYTSLDLDEIIELLMSITEYNIVADAGFPTAGQITTGNIGSKGSCVIPVDLTTNVKWLHEFLFNDTDYQVSENVRNYTQRIYNETAEYLDGRLADPQTYTGENDVEATE